MAFVWKHPQSKYWIARFSDPTGKRRNRSTRTVNRKLAQKMAAEFEIAANQKRTARQMRTVITSLHREITGEETAGSTVREFIAQWLATKQPETAPATLAFYTGATTRFIEWLGLKADAEISDITREDVIAFRNAEAARSASKTANHKLKCLRMVFKAAKRDGLLSEDPTEFVETVRSSHQKQRRPFSIPELRAVLDAADEQWRSMILCGLYTGQRLSDVASLTWQNIDLVKGEIRLVTRKTGKVMMVPIAAPLRRQLESVAGDDPEAPLHPRAYGTVHRQRRTGTLSNQFADILAAAGLRTKTPHRRKDGERSHHALSFHSLRATATTLLHEAGVPAAVAQALIGHDSEEVHRLYVKVGGDALRTAAESLPNIL